MSAIIAQGRHIAQLLDVAWWRRMLEKLSHLLSLKEASAALGISVFTLRRLIDGGAVRAVNVGARRLISVAEVERISVNGTGKPRARKPRTGRQRSV
jgi:excisionase family DNA binding protein